MTIVLAIPMPPTSSATAPRPRNRPVSALSACARAASASEGRLTSTSSGCSALAADGSSSWMRSTADGSARRYTVLAERSAPSSRTAAS